MKKLYSAKEIQEDIEDKIRKEIYKPDDKLATEKKMMETYGVSRTTIRNVINALLVKRIVYKIPDVGVFVEKEIIRKTNKIMGFTELVLDSGRIPKTVLENHGKKIPSEKILDEMNLPLNTEVFYMQRKRYINDQPFLYEDVYISPLQAKDIEKYDLEKESLYDILRNKYNINIHYLKEKVSAVTVDHKISDFLYQTSTGYALKVEGLSYDLEDKVIEYGISYYHAKNFSFESVLVSQK